MRLLLNPAFRRLWRDHDVLQLGIDPGHALVLDGVDASATSVLSLLDGTRDRGEVLARAGAAGIEPRAVDGLLDLLRVAGAVCDADDGAGALASLATDERERLAPDLASWALVSGGPAAAVEVLQRRRRAHVLVVGAGRVGGTVGALLAATGVGRLTVDDPARARPGDAAPGGLRVADRGVPRERAAAGAIGRAAGGVRRPASGEAADLVVLTPTDALPPSLVLGLTAAGTPHLSASVREVTGIVGPLVLPGRSTCLRCLDLTRTDSDPAWPLLHAQLIGGSPVAEACDSALAVLVASVTALQALAFLDAGDAPAARLPATVGGTLEVRLPDWRLRRRTWSPHPDCGCLQPAGPVPEATADQPSAARLISRRAVAPG